MKIQLIEKAIDELRLAQTKPWTRPRDESSNRLRLPPALPLSDGQQIPATEELLQIVSQYSALWVENNPDLKNRLKEAEVYRIVSEAFGEVLAYVELDRSKQEPLHEVKDKIDREIRIRTDRNGERLEVVLGCELLRSPEIYPIKIGPVTFQTKIQWCESALANREISDVTERRLRKLWAGRSIKKRKMSVDAAKEESIIDAVGASTTVCTVMCDGLSWKMINEKSILTARLAMSALSLMWRRPSSGLRWMNLIYDGDVYHKHYVAFGADGRFGSSSSMSQMPEGVSASSDFEKHVKDYSSTLGLLGEVLQTYVQPRYPATRPAVQNALFLSLWWFHEGCRETSDQIATTKFSASMDALTGGKKMNGIVALIGARLGPKPDEQFMKDGRTTKRVMQDLYNGGRSRLIHGSSEDYAHDWTSSRATAEIVARLCLVEATNWLSENPKADKIEHVLSK